MYFWPKNATCPGKGTCRISMINRVTGGHRGLRVHGTGAARRRQHEMIYMERTSSVDVSHLGRTSSEEFGEFGSWNQVYPVQVALRGSNADRFHCNT